jgi:Tfp pilus assembly protein PilF
LRLRPDLAEAHYNLAAIYLREGNSDLARRELEVVLKIRPDLYEARQLLNDILSRPH